MAYVGLSVASDREKDFFKFNCLSYLFSYLKSPTLQEKGGLYKKWVFLP